MNLGVMVGIVFMLMVILCVNIFILAWSPNFTESYVIYFMVVGLALTQSISNSQIRGLYGVYFPNNSSAFTASAMGLTTGLAFGAFASTFMCIQIKVYIYILIILISLITYICLSLKHSTLKEKINNDTSIMNQIEKF